MTESLPGEPVSLTSNDIESHLPMYTSRNNLGDNSVDDSSDLDNICLV